MIEEPDEHSTRDTAQQLAGLIERYWHANGYGEVRAWSERTARSDGAGHDRIWGVKSNLVNGLPPGYEHGGLRKPEEAV